MTPVPPIESIEGGGLPLRGNDIDTPYVGNVSAVIWRP